MSSWWRSNFLSNDGTNDSIPSRSSSPVRIVRVPSVAEIRSRADTFKVLDLKSQSYVEVATASKASEIVIVPAAVSFDKSLVSQRLQQLWSLPQEFGREQNPFDAFLDGPVADRFVLTSGLQLLRDELQFAYRVMRDKKNYPKLRNTISCVSDVALPSVLCTLAHTNCGDRICQAASKVYEKVVASRFASISETGEIKPEVFYPTGGGTDDGATLAHVTVAHMGHKDLKDIIYAGNAKSFSLVCMDLKTHAGKLHLGLTDSVMDRGKTISDVPSYFGSARESIWRDPRVACGAIFGCLNGYNPLNPVHVRLRGDLGEDNFQYLSKNQILADNGIPVTYLVAAAIVAVTGMTKAAKALLTEMDDRGVASLTASITVNMANVGVNDYVVYVARATVFDGCITKQGLGRHATKYTAVYLPDEADGTIRLMYDGTSFNYPVVDKRYFDPVDVNAKPVNKPSH